MSINYIYGAAALGTVAALLTGCSAETLAEEDLEAGLPDFIAVETGQVPESVDCSDDLQVTEGEQLDCVATIDGEEHTTTVTVVEAGEGYDYQTRTEGFTGSAEEAESS